MSILSVFYKLRNNKKILCCLFLLHSTLSFSQVNKIKHEFSVGFNTTFFDKQTVNNLLQKQNLPTIGAHFEGTHLNFSALYKEMLFRISSLWARSINNSDNYKNKSNFNTVAFSAYYPFLNSSKDVLFLGLAIQSSLYQTIVSKNQSQDFQNLNMDRIDLSNKNWSFAGKLLYNTNSKSFPILLELSYALGFKSDWNIESANSVTNTVSDNFNRFSLSFDIPIISKK